jgi:hypothetical protein
MSKVEVCVVIGKACQLVVVITQLETGPVVEVLLVEELVDEVEVEVDEVELVELVVVGTYS